MFVGVKYLRSYCAVTVREMWIWFICKCLQLFSTLYSLCGHSKNHKWKFETWWWDEEADKTIQEKRAWFKAHSSLKRGCMTMEAKWAKNAYIDVKRVAKCAVCLAKSEAKKEELSQYPLIMMVFPYCKINRTVYLMMPVSFCSLTKTKWKQWVEHYARLLNVEFE